MSSDRLSKNYCWVFSHLLCFLIVLVTELLQVDCHKDIIFYKQMNKVYIICSKKDSFKLVEVTYSL